MVQPVADGEVQLMMVVLDFLMEVVQGPCAANQVILAQSSMVHSCRQLILWQMNGVTMRLSPQRPAGGLQGAA